MANPCYGCTKRTMDCHSHCKEYFDFVQENNAQKEKLRRERKYNDDFTLSRKACFKPKKK